MMVMFITLKQEIENAFGHVDSKSPKQCINSPTKPTPTVTAMVCAQGGRDDYSERTSPRLLVFLLGGCGMRHCLHDHDARQSG